MNDKIIINTISKIYFILVSFLSFIFLLLSFIFILLQNGIYIDNISIPNIEVKKLYIKWNEKIDLSIEEAKITTDKNKKNTPINYTKIHKTFKQLALLENWFEKISINRINIDDISANFEYKYGEYGFLNASSPDFLLKSSLNFESDLLNIHIDEFKDLKRKIDIHGNVILNTKMLEITSIVFVNINNDASFKVFANANKKKLLYTLESLQAISSTKYIFQILNLPSELKYWTQDAIQMSDLSIHSIDGWLDYKNLNQAYKNIHIKAIAHGLFYSYDKELDSIQTKNTELEFKNGILFIRPEQAYTYDFFLDKSWLKIDFTPPQELLTLHLLFKGMLNEDLLKVLNRYKIKLPFLQNTGTVDTNLKLVVNLQTIDVRAKGDFFTKKANFDYLGLNIDIFDAYISLDNNDIVINDMIAKYKNIAMAKVDVLFNAKESVGKIKFKIEDLTLKDADLRLNTTKKPLSVIYNITPAKDTINFSQSEWVFKEHSVNIDELSIPFNLEKLTANIPITSVSVPNLLSTLVSGELSLRPNKLNLDVDILKCTYNGIELSQSNAPLKIIYDGKINIISKENIRFNADDLEFILHKTSVNIVEDKINIKYSSFDIKDLLKATFSGNYNFKNSTGLINVGSINIKNESVGNIFSDQDTLSLSIEALDDKLLLKLEELDIDYVHTDKTWKLKLNSLYKVSQYSKVFRDYNLTDGDLTIYKVIDSPKIKFYSKIKYPYQILTNNNTPIEDYKIKGNIDNDSKNISLNINDSIDVNISSDIQITAKKVGININALMNFLNANNTNSEKKIDKNINFNAKDSYLYIGNNRHVISDDINLQYFDNILNVQLTHKNGSAGFKLENNEFYLYGDKFNDEFMENLFAFSKFKGGDLSFTMNGTTKEYNGIFYIKNTTIIEYRLLNNILAFINTIPSLVTFSLPDYDKDGLAVKSAYINFHYRDDVLNASDIYLDSKEIDILGRGKASFKHDSVDLKLNLKTDLGSSLSKIPVVGYILLDKDSISTSLSVKGKLSDPEVRSLIAQEIIIAPLNIIKRTLLLPLHLFTKEKEEE